MCAIKKYCTAFMLLLVMSVSAVTLFEIKDEYGNPVFIVDSDGVTIMRWDYESGTKALGDTLMTISSRSIRANIRSDSKALARSFSVTTSGSSKGKTNVLDVNTSSAILREESGTEYSVFSPENIFLGSEAGGSITGGKYNVFLGNNAGYNTQGNFTPQNPDVGSKNIFAGFESGYSNIDGYNNIYLGFQAGYNNQQGNRSVFIGDHAGMNTTESFNVFIGDQSGKSNTSGFFNVFLGGNSGISNEGGFSNTFLGYGAGYHNVNGNHNTAVGVEAGSKYGGTGNTSVGTGAGKALYGTATDYNTNIGYYAGHGNRGSGNVFIGANAGRTGTWIGELISNRLMISNEFDVIKPLIQGHFPNNSIYLNADSVKVGGLVSGFGNAVYRDAATGFLVASSSDVRLKENISPIKNGLDKVSKLQGVNFTWKSDENHENKIGFIAQEVEKVLPEVVFTNEADGYKGINYAEITVVLVEAVKELQQENRELKKRVSEIERLKAEMDLLREHISLTASK